MNFNDLIGKPLGRLELKKWIRKLQERIYYQDDEFNLDAISYESEEDESDEDETEFFDKKMPQQQVGTKLMKAIFERFNPIKKIPSAFVSSPIETEYLLKPQHFNQQSSSYELNDPNCIPSRPSIKTDEYANEEKESIKTRAMNLMQKACSGLILIPYDSNDVIEDCYENKNSKEQKFDSKGRKRTPVTFADETSPEPQEDKKKEESTTKIGKTNTRKCIEIKSLTRGKKNKKKLEEAKVCSCGSSDEPSKALKKQKNESSASNLDVSKDSTEKNAVSNLKSSKNNQEEYERKENRVTGNLKDSKRSKETCKQQDNIKERNDALNKYCVQVSGSTKNKDLTDCVKKSKSKDSTKKSKSKERIKKSKSKERTKNSKSKDCVKKSKSKDSMKKSKSKSSMKRSKSKDTCECNKKKDESKPFERGKIIVKEKVKEVIDRKKNSTDSIISGGKKKMTEYKSNIKGSFTNLRNLHSDSKFSKIRCPSCMDCGNFIRSSITNLRNKVFKEKKSDSQFSAGKNIRSFLPSKRSNTSSSGSSNSGNGVKLRFNQKPTAVHVDQTNDLSNYSYSTILSFRILTAVSIFCLVRFIFSFGFSIFGLISFSISTVHSTLGLIVTNKISEISGYDSTVAYYKMMRSFSDCLLVPFLASELWHANHYDIHAALIYATVCLLIIPSYFTENKVLVQKFTNIIVPLGLAIFVIVSLLTQNSSGLAAATVYGMTFLSDDELVSEINMNMTEFSNFCQCLFLYLSSATLRATKYKHPLYFCHGMQHC